MGSIALAAPHFLGWQSPRKRDLLISVATLVSIQIPVAQSPKAIVQGL